MASAIVPPIYDATLADRRAAVRTEDAQQMTRRLAREEGVLAGVSSGAAALAALRLGAELGAASVAVVFPDGGERYLSERFWE
jgi:cysteine synthase B